MLDYQCVWCSLGRSGRLPSERRTAQVNAYADQLAQEYERKEKEAMALRKQIEDLKANLNQKCSIKS